MLDLQVEISIICSKKQPEKHTSSILLIYECATQAKSLSCRKIFGVETYSLIFFSGNLGKI